MEPSAQQTTSKLVSSIILPRTAKKTKKKGATDVAPKPPKEDGGDVQTELLILRSELFNYQEQELAIQLEKCSVNQVENFSILQLTSMTRLSMDLQTSSK